MEFHVQIIIDRNLNWYRDQDMMILDLGLENDQILQNPSVKIQDPDYTISIQNLTNMLKMIEFL